MFAACLTSTTYAQIAGGGGNANVDGEITSTETRVNGVVGDLYEVRDVVYWLANSTVEHDANSPEDFAAFAIQVRIFKLVNGGVVDIATDQDSVFVLKGSTSPLNEDCSGFVLAAVPPASDPDFLFCAASIRYVDENANVTYLDSATGSFRRADEAGIGD